MNKNKCSDFSNSMPIQERIFALKQLLPSSVELVAVSKFHPNEAIRAAYAGGQRAFAESRPQELAAKVAALPQDIAWHFIGHLQRNKVDLVVGVADLIESVDSERLLAAVAKEAVKKGVTQKILLQIHIAQEESKQGFSAAEATEILNKTIDGIEVVGLMGMASFTQDQSQVRQEFGYIKSLFDRYTTLSVLSIGMSGDWPLAVECGATEVRIGSAIFGERNY